MSDPVICTECSEEIHPLEVFSKGECLKCHEKAFIFDGSPVDIIPSINI